MTFHYRQSLIAAFTGHFVLLVAAIVVSLVPGCLPTGTVDLPVELLDVPPAPRTRSSPVPVPPPPAPDDDRRAPPDPGPPPDPLPPRPPDRAPVKPPAPAAVDPGRNIRRHAVTNAPRVTVTNTPHAAIKIGPRTERLLPGRPLTANGTRQPVRRPRPSLSVTEWNHMLGVPAGTDADPGLPMDERTRGALLIKRALYDAWEQPALADAGSRPAQLELRLDATGGVTGFRISQPSGSETFDRSALRAAQAVARINGLTPRFLEAFPRVIVEFKLTE